MGSKVKKILGAALPVAAAFVPGIGPLAAAGLGAAGGALSGGGLKGALLGGVTGGVGNYLSAGAGLTGIGNSLGLTGQGSLLGSAVGAPFSNTIAGPGLGSGILGDASKAISGLTASGAGGTGGSVSSFGNGLGSLFSGVSSTKANKDAERALLAAQGRSEQLLTPFTNAKFEPGDLTQDPGYQFRLQEGQQAIDRSLGARGNLFSGQALKAAQEYGQGLADSTYNDAYTRYLQQQGQNFGGAQALSNVYDNQGNIRANASVNNSNVLNRSLSGLFGNGAFSNTGASQDSDLLRRYGLA
jgi:hypothetical protein